MLTEEEKREIDRDIANYEIKQAACIEAMKVVQQRRGGWLDDAALGDIAAYLEMSPDELESVASFYTHIHRKPVGRHILRVCNSVSCWVMGYEQLHAHLRQRLGVELGETTPDGRFTYLPAVCLGTCDHAPAMMIDEQTFTDLDPARLDAILDEYENGGRP